MIDAIYRKEPYTIDDAYLQSMVSIQLAILFLAGIISAWTYILYKK